MKITKFNINGLILIKPDIFKDDRGFFAETYNYEKYKSIGIDCMFLQDNHSKSIKNVIRGLHYQTFPGQAKLVRVISGEIFDVAVDVRPKSPTFGQHQSVILSAENHNQFFIPVGFAHGFAVLSEEAQVVYKCSSVYDQNTESSIYYGDLGINWPVENPILSQRDQNSKTFKEVFGE